MSGRRGLIGASVAALASVFSTLPDLRPPRGYYDPGEKPQPRRAVESFPPKWGRRCAPGSTLSADISGQLMRELGIRGGRQKRNLRKRARREGWAS